LIKQKRVFGIPDFKLYGMGDGLNNFFRRYPGKITDPPLTGLELMQFGIGFT